VPTAPAPAEAAKLQGFWATDEETGFGGGLRVGREDDASRTRLEGTLKAGHKGAAVEVERSRSHEGPGAAEVEDVLCASGSASRAGELELGAGAKRVEHRDGTTTTRGVHGGLSREDGELGVRAAATFGRHDEHGGTDLGAQVGYDADGVGAGGSRVDEAKDDQGGVRRDERSGSVATGDDHVTFAGGRTTSARDAQGQITAQDTRSGHLGLGREGLAGGLGSTSVGPDGARRGAFANGSVAWENGLSVEASGGAQLGATSVTLSAGTSLSASEPAEVDGHWVVTYRRSEAVGGGLGAEGASLGASVSGRHEVVDSGTRLFASREEAMAFKEHLLSNAPLPADLTRASAALAIPVGETRVHGVVDGVGGSVSAPIGPMHVGAHGDAHRDRATLVKRVSDTLVDVTLSDGSAVGAGLGAGVGPAELHASLHHADSQSRTVRFDLADAAGRAAFERFEEDGSIDPRYGLELEASRTRQRGTEGGGGVGAVLSTSTDATISEREVRAGGHTTETLEGKNTQKSGFFGRKTEESASLDATAVDGGERSFALTRTVGSTSGDATSAALADATGTKDAAAHRERGASGRYTVSTRLDEAQVQHVVDDAVAGKLDVGGGNLLERALGDEAVEHLRDARTPEGRARALAELTARLGPRATAAIEGHAGAGPGGLPHEVALEGDAYLTGPRFREENDALVRGLGGALEDPAGDPAAVLRAAADGLARLRERRLALRDLARYPDLPDGLRVEEVAKTDAYIAQVEALRQRALSGLRGGHDPMAALLGKGAVDPHALRLQELMGQVDAFDAKLAGGKAHLASVESGARAAQWVHGGAHARSLLSAREQLGASDGEAAAEYQRADQRSAEGQDAMRALAAFEPLVDSTRAAFLSALDQPDAAIPAGEALVALLAAEDRLLGKAASAERGVTYALRDIEDRHRAQSELFAGYAHALPEGLG
jgi:hypothetical protein